MQAVIHVLREVTTEVERRNVHQIPACADGNDSNSPRPRGPRAQGHPFRPHGIRSKCVFVK